MNNKSKRWRISFILTLFLFSIALIYSIYSFTIIPQKYIEKQENEIKIVKKQIEETINNDQEFTYLKENYPIELLVYNETENKTIYSSIPVKSVVDINKSLNRNAIAFEEYYKYKHNNKEYNIWLLQYHISPQNIFNTWMSTLMIIISVIVIFNIVSIIIFYLELLRPTRKLKDNILKISKYQLDLLSLEKGSFESDELSRKLVVFAKEVESYMSSANISYTQLEKDLQMQNELLDYKSKTIASLTHNLKTPLVTSNLYATTYLKNGYNKLDIENYLKMSLKDNTRLLNEINSISQIVYSHNQELNKQEEFDLIKILLETYDVYLSSWQSKGLKIEFDIDEKIIITSNKSSIKQLISNAMSNIYMYAKQDGNVVVSCFQENDNIYLSFYNDAKQLDDEQLVNVFKLFYRINNDQIGQGYWIVYN